jgi:prepilin-type N-terminal cleavage/methylation domain-containing protein
MIDRRLHTWNERGFTLTEILVVVAIVGVLLSIATFGFHQWMVKSNVEAEVRQMLADFSQLRFRAVTTKQNHSITINPNGYVFKSYTSVDEPAAAGTVIPGGTHNVNYQLKSSKTTLFAGEIYQITPLGTINMNVALFPNEIIPIYVAYDVGAPNLDCVNIHVARVSAGKTNATGDNCDER